MPSSVSVLFKRTEDQQQGDKVIICISHCWCSLHFSRMSLHINADINLAFPAGRRFAHEGPR